jgi:hypothetical protein
LLDGLEGEVGVTAVDHLKKCDLRVAGKVNVLPPHAFDMRPEYTLGALDVANIS